jgi:ABC-type branched-subunit amino acid transport system ATPase component
MCRVAFLQLTGHQNRFERTHGASSLVEQNTKLTLNLADVIINMGSVVFRGTPAELNANDAVISQPRSLLLFGNGHQP